MSAHPLNYCRQIVRAFEELRGAHPDREYENTKNLAIGLARAAQKFVLPDRGKVLDDPSLAAINEDVPLGLPFPIIALEYEYSGSPQTGLVGVPKRCVLAAQPQSGQEILLLPVGWFQHEDPQWIALHAVVIPATGYIERTAPIKVNLKPTVATDEWTSADYQDEVTTLFGFLNALACRNVRAESIGPARPRRRKAGDDSLPFDEYHILTIGVPATRGSEREGMTHRSPREHLRRGHIRRLATGASIWVNATVVNHGSVGSVAKTYALRGSA